MTRVLGWGWWCRRMVVLALVVAVVMDGGWPCVVMVVAVCVGCLVSRDAVAVLLRL
jgi:hypothetical protein